MNAEKHERHPKSKSNPEILYTFVYSETSLYIYTLVKSKGLNLIRSLHLCGELNFSLEEIQSEGSDLFGNWKRFLSIILDRIPEASK